MHIVDGALTAPVVIGATALAVAGVGLGIRQLPLDKIPAAGVLSAAFFIGSLIHVPLGPSSVHLIINGLAGLILGWAAFPALFIGLLLQAVFFGFGGLTVLGVNTVAIALPAVLVYYLCRRGIAYGSARGAALWGALGGGLSIALTAVLVALALALSGEAFIPAAQFVLVAHVPVVVIEAALSGAAVYLAYRVKPALFQILPALPAASPAAAPASFSQVGKT